MPNIELSSYECSRRLLPRLCMECGERADVKKSRIFSWFPAWLYLAMPLAGLPFLILLRVFKERMRVEVPLCRDHQNHWMKRGLLALPLFLLCFPGGCFLITWGMQPDAPTILLVPLGLGLFVFLVIAIVVMRKHTIRAIEITDDTITLALVHANFVVALEEEREQDHKEAEREREQRRQRREAEKFMPPPLPRRRTGPERDNQDRRRRRD